jgi:RND superfamily putative drug exporter
MATFLYRLGRFAFRHRIMVFLSWLAVFLLAAVGASAASPPAPTAFSMPGTEAQRAFDLLDERFPGANADGATARVVFKAPEGERITQQDHRAAIAKTLREIKEQSPQVAAVVDPFTNGTVSPDGAIAYSSISYKVRSAALTEETKEALQRTAEATATETALAVELGGSVVPTKAEGGTETIGVAIAAIVLLITFGSLVAAGLPLLTALLGVGIGVSAIAAVANTFDLGNTTSTLAMMLGLAVGIDYALFIVTRYRAELAEGHNREEAAGRALGTAGSAVVFAGLTVVIALAGLSVVGIPMLTKMGLAAAATVALAVVVALTLLPALLSLAGKWIVGRRARKRATSSRPVHRGKGRWGAFILRRPAVILIVGVLGLGALAVPATSLQLGLPDEGSMAAETTQRKAYDLLSEGFGPGFNGPLLLVVDAQKSADAQNAADQVIATVKHIEGVAGVGPAAFNEAGDTATITVTPAFSPSSVETERLVKEVRKRSTDVGKQTKAQMLVTGQTGMAIDFSKKMADALLPYLALIVGLAFLLLMVVFRSVLVPLKAALGFLLSVGAALGAVVAVFQWGWLASALGVEQTGPIMSTMPIFMAGIVFGLAMDYEVFLVTRIREAYVRGESARQAITTGFRHGSRVVTAAAVIMMAVFGGFIGSGEEMVKMMGFGLAAAVLFDAFIVRMAIVPAALALLGSRAWWLPGWLDRILPNVDVEGEGLRTNLRPPDPARTVPTAGVSQ